MKKMVSVCPNCNHPQISVPGENFEPIECPYCGIDFDQEDIQPNEMEFVRNGLDNDIMEMMHNTQTINCNYCNHNNPFSNNYCEKCGSNLSWASVVVSEQTTEKKLNNQLSPDQREKCLIVGILAFMKALMKREGNLNGLLFCQSCNTKYKFDAFFCPSCGGETWLTEMREVLQGSIRNFGLIDELRKSFPHFKIIGYANSAAFRSGMTNSMKIELENIATNAMKILEASAVYLKANTQDIKKTKHDSEDDSVTGSLFGLFSEGMSDASPDERVMEFLGDTTIHHDEGSVEIPEGESSVDQPNAESDPSPDDWF